MDASRRLGAVYWIDDFAVGSNDLDRWLDSMQKVVGARNWVQVGPAARRTAVFQKVTKYCGQDCFPQLGGGRLVYKQVDELGERAPGGGKIRGQHAALVVPHDEFVAAYERVYRLLPEEDDCDPTAP